MPTTSISLKKYIAITSGVGAGNGVAEPSLMGRVMSINSLIDPNTVLIFGDPVSVGNYFGTSSYEYKRAVKYFNYISPSIRQPSNLSFARWCNAASPASIFGKAATYVVATLNAVVAGTITFNFGGTPVVVAGISLAAAGSLAAVATALQTAFRANADPHLTTCTVTYDAVNSKFDFVASPGSVTSASFAITQTGSGVTDLADELGWYGDNTGLNGALITASNIAEQPLDGFTRSVQTNNSFGSFCFTAGGTPTFLQLEAVGSANAANYNNLYMFCINVKPENVTAWAAGLATTNGVAMTYELDALDEYPEMIPMSIMAATDYTQRNGVQNYMYRQMANTTPSVTDDPTSTSLDGQRVNYYGQTQINGQVVQFYQNGVLMGTGTSPQSQNVFANESWLKRAAAAALMTAQLNLPIISANDTGRGQVQAVLLQDVIPAATFNGTISAGKTLNTIQQLYITTLTGDDSAWHAVQTNGFWLDVEIASTVNATSGITTYSANYTLIYGKDDAVNAINGTHVLI